MKFINLLTISVALTLSLTACATPNNSTTIQSEKALIQPTSQSTTVVQSSPNVDNKTENSQTTDTSKQSTAKSTTTPTKEETLTPTANTSPVKETPKTVLKTEQEDTAKIISVTSPAARNSTATLKAKVAPNATASIVVHYKSGASKAAGLESKKADSNGNVSWFWHVGGNTTLGNWKITVSSGNSSAETSFEVVH
ncbi:hypothetical protein [Paenibacillus sp. KN14-4R]|uniref:hypothetical protein n=1 Tax=Paenibacillus sp. KN14-4R TaxID=3445773 RepID=UPI003FA104A0